MQLNVIQVVKADDYNTRPDNTRAVVRDFSRPRGRIITADGAVLAQSVPSSDKFKYQRAVPDGRPVRRGRRATSRSSTAPTASRSSTTTCSPGHTASQQVQGLLNFLDERPNIGDVTLTVRTDIQKVAKQALGDREGAVVAVDTRTGAILALWSYPSYDPNMLASHDFKAVTAARDALLADPRNPLLGETYRERYFPGSTFKIVTTTAGLDTARSRRQPCYPPTKTYVPPGTTDPIENYGGTTLRRRPARGVPPQLQHRVRPDGRRHRAPRAWWPRPPGVRLQPDAADRPAPAGAELLPAGRGVPQRHAASWPRRPSARTTCRSRR